VRAWATYGALALSVLATPLAAQPVSEGESHIASAFTSGADPRVFADDVRLGPALRRELGAESDSRKIYAALAGRIAGKPLRVDVLPPAQAARYASLVGGSLSDPLIVLESGELALLMQYAAKDKHVTFVEQLRGPRAEVPQPKAEAAPAQVEAPQLPPALKLAPAPRAQKPRPRGECVIKPVMSEEDLWNCSAPASASPRPTAIDTPAPPVAAQTPQPAAAGAPKPRAECVIKPVMTDEDLRACASVTASRALVVMNTPAPVVAVAKAEPTPPPAPRECVIKPVMSEEDLRACGAR